jgi:drug/metabolite transporter (DMT)-like permease
VLAVAVGFLGSAAFALAHVGSGASVAGDALVLCASLVAAAYGVAARRVATGGHSDPLTVTAVQLLTAALLAVPVVLLAGGSQTSHLTGADLDHLLAAVATGLLGSAIPFVLYNITIRDIDVTGAALILNLIPVFGVVLAIVLLGEGLGLPQLIGGAAVVFAAFGVEDRTATRGLPA